MHDGGMEIRFFCRGCGVGHNEPAEAQLGHLVLCLNCAIGLAFLETETCYDAVDGRESDHRPSIAA